MAQELFSEVAAELHVVGEPQGPHRAERLRGRISRPRQHWRVRSQLAAPDGRLSGTGRWHRMDGALFPKHARDRERAGDGRSGVRGAVNEVRRTLPVDCVLDDAYGRPHRNVDEEDGFFYDVLRLPTGEAQRLKVRSMVGLLPLCAATVFEGEVFPKYPEIRERFRRSSKLGQRSGQRFTIQ